MAASMKNVAGQVSKLLLRIRAPKYFNVCQYSTEISVQEDEEPEYPPIKPKYPPGNWSQDLTPRQCWKYYETGESLLEKDDVRERLEYMSSSKPIYMTYVKSWDRYPKTLEYKQFATRTKILDGLPEVYKNVDCETEYQKLKPLLISTIVQEIVERTKASSEINEKVEFKQLFSNIFDAILSVSAHSHEHLLRAQVDKNVRVETFWRLTGFLDTSVASQNGRNWMQYKGKRALQIRTELPLPEFIPWDDERCSGGDLPVVDYSPFTIGQRDMCGRPISVAGHWIGDPCEFTHLSVEPLERTYEKFVRAYKDKPELIEQGWTQCGLTSGFSSCMAQAHNLGFSMYHDLTYPITTQTVLTDGKFIQLFAYQLNTMHLWQTREANPRNNMVWISNKYQLFDSVCDGQVHGFNDEAFKELLKFVLLAPVDRGCDLRPYVKNEHSPAKKRLFINYKGDEPLPHKKIERFQYPRNAVYF